MAPGHRLGGLQMGKARHDPIRACLGLPQAKVRRHLVIPGPARVQTACWLTDDLFQARLDIHVNVFKFGAKGEIARLDL